MRKPGGQSDQAQPQAAITKHSFEDRGIPKCNLRTSIHEPLIQPETMKTGPMHDTKARCLKSPLEGGAAKRRGVYAAAWTCNVPAPKTRSARRGGIHPPTLRAIRLRLEASAGQAASRGDQECPRAQEIYGAGSQFESHGASWAGPISPACGTLPCGFRKGASRV